MDCPKCGNELEIRTHEDYSNPSKGIEVVAECSKCESNLYSFLNIKDFEPFEDKETE